ncbi:hypothetical protein P4O66_013994 [Electrophorus voltai]|uniref:Claudin n=1 Tax=Electrophorus voltai TaxID=2609070 RepID=A0AAD9DRC7_9TELE|nr:hypothetical protein P4O66_013994 [Electrophorus voltai]
MLQENKMVALGLEILGVTLASLGWIVGIVSCALPMWRVTAFIGSNIVTAQIIWEGIWMSCVVQSTGQMQCKVYDSMLALSSDLQAARALCVISILLGVLGVLVSVVGAKCTNCIEEEQTKAKVMIAAGATFVCAAVMQLIPVSWSAHAIIMDFYNPLITEAQKREIGASLYLGWASAALLLIGGVILCCSCPPREEKRYGPAGRMVYSTTRARTGQGRVRLPLCDVTALEDSTSLPDLGYKGYCQRLGAAATMSAGLELIGIVLGVLGCMLAIIACALPMWRVTAFIGYNIVTAQIMWEGLWMSCVVQSTGQMQCKIYDSMLALSTDLQAARALTVISILLIVVAVLVFIVGAQCTNCIEDETAKAKVVILAGVLFVAAGLMQLIPVCWNANTIIRDFYNPLLSDSQRRELGAALYIGLAAAALLLLGGSLLCCSCPPREKKYSPSQMSYQAPRSTVAAAYDRRDYV